ncbi:MAG: OmpL47-type beta-barrel domain-containing protein [Bryobacteraceae bacterium]
MRSAAGAILVPTLFALLGHPGLVFGSILHVPTEQPTIQAAINAAVNGDTVLIAPGTYFENINFSGKAITVTSEQGPAVTIIDGGSLGPVATFANSETTQSVLSGLTLQHGQGTFAAGYGGGGIHIANASPTISGNVITNNTAGSFGGGIFVQSGSPIIKKNTITNNGQIPGSSGGVGGGIYIAGTGSAQVIGNTISNNQQAQGFGGAIGINAASPTIQNNFISANSSYSQGGAIYVINTSSPLIVQNLIVGNSAGTGGGVYWSIPSGSAPFLLSNTVSNNSALTQGSAVYVSGFLSSSELIDNIIVSAVGTSTLYCDPSYSATPPIVKANDIFASSGTAYVGSCSSLGGKNGNLSLDPEFREPASTDYHLLTGSPAIDAGISDPALIPTDFDGNVRVQDGDGNGTLVVDMGAYEAPGIDVAPPFTTASVNPPPNASGWSKTNVAVALTATDNAGGTGVKQIDYTMSGMGPQVVTGNSANLTFSAEGIATLTYGAVDNAGNLETPKSLAIKIDKTAPVISGMPAPGCTLSPPKHQMVKVAVVTASDALSGVASLNVSATSNEPDGGTGGGDLPGDIVTTGGNVQLRAERAPGGKGRIYTITANALDFAGNSSTATATCAVPK